MIEAATEKEDVKRKIFAELCPSLKPEALVASNTSSISITRLAASTDRPEKFIGIHFMNPVPLMELVELIRGIATADATFEASKEFVTKLGKTIAVAEDFPAFIVNRILLPMINEAIYTLYEGVGNVEGIDTAMRLGAHHPMGPLELADFIGLDTCLSVMQVLHEGLADFEIPAVPAAGEICRGRLARQEGRPRLLRLPRRQARPDALDRWLLRLDPLDAGRQVEPVVAPGTPVQFPGRRKIRLAEAADRYAHDPRQRLQSGEDGHAACRAEARFIPASRFRRTPPARRVAGDFHGGIREEGGV